MIKNYDNRIFTALCRLCDIKTEPAILKWEYSVLYDEMNYRFIAGKTMVDFQVPCDIAFEDIEERFLVPASEVVKKSLSDLE